MRDILVHAAQALPAAVAIGGSPGPVTAAAVIRHLSRRLALTLARWPR